MFISKQLARKAALERGKRNIKFLGRVAGNTAKRAGSQVVDFVKHPVQTGKDVGKGVINDNVGGLAAFGQNVSSVVNVTNHNEVPLSKKIKFVGTAAAGMACPAAFGAINTYDTAMHVAGKKGNDVVESLANMQANPHKYLGRNVVERVRKTRVGTLGSGAVQTAIGGKWLGSNEISSITGVDPGAAGSVTRYNIGVTPGGVMGHLGDSWEKRTKINLGKEKTDFMKSKDARGFAWWYDRKVAPTLNKVADKNAKITGKVNSKIDTAGVKISEGVKSAGSVLSGLFKKRTPQLQPVFS